MLDSKYSYFNKKFVHTVTGILKYAEIRKIGWLQTLTLIAVKRMDGCEYSIEIIRVHLKERMAGTTFFENKHATAERTTQTMDDCNSSYQDKYGTFQRMGDYHSFHDKNRYITSRNGWLH